MFKLVKLFTLLFTLFALVSCAGTPTQESTGQYLDSTAITAKVKAKLVERLGTKGFGIKVKTYKDQVQLSGFVDSAQVKQQAERIAANVKDVHKIRNDLIIK